MACPMQHTQYNNAKKTFLKNDIFDIIEHGGHIYTSYHDSANAPLPLIEKDYNFNNKQIGNNHIKSNTSPALYIYLNQVQ